MISCAAMQVAYRRCLESWGGATFNVLSGEFLADNAEGYVFAISPTISLPENVDWRMFRGACIRLCVANPEARYFGFFHDNAKRTIELNQVAVVKTRREVDEAHASGIEMPGGAYELHTGDGYWPQGRPQQYA